MATASNTPYNDCQLVNLGLRLIKNMSDFEQGLQHWYDCPQADQTWMNFKIHFEDAYASLLCLRGPSMRNTAFQQQANAISRQVLSEIQRENSTLADSISKATEDKLVNAFALLQTADNENQENIPPLPSANSLSSDPVALEMLKLLKDIRTDMKKSRTTTTPLKTIKRKNESDQDETKKRKKPRRRLDVSKYCWTHGACNHHSKDCKFKAPGHKDGATFCNMMGGCKDFCQVCNDE